MKRKLDPRTRERVLNAAAATDADTARESAILGGIARSLLDTGQLSISFIRHMVPQALNWFDETAREIHYHATTDGRVTAMYRPPDMSMPTDDEIRVVARRFIANYDPGSTIGVKA